MLPAIAPATAGSSGLDGLRGLAVIAVLLFHQGFGWARGGYLGVSLFFTLSGFLIARLLLAEVEGTGRIRLGRVLATTVPATARSRRSPRSRSSCAYGAWFATESQKLALRGDVWASLAQVANWRFVGLGVVRRPVPGSVAGAALLVVGDRGAVLSRLPAPARRESCSSPRSCDTRGGARDACSPAWCSLLMAGSLAAQLLLSSSVDRVYYGTDTRAFELLAGVLLACWWRPHARRIVDARQSRRRRRRRRSPRHSSSTGGRPPASAPPWLFHGGFALVAVVSAIVIASATVPGPVRALGSFRPFVAIGLISYGVYLYHWPVFLALDPARTGLDGWALFGAARRCHGRLRRGLVPLPRDADPARRLPHAQGRRGSRGSAACSWS